VSDAISVLIDRKSLLSEDSLLERVIVAALQYYGARHLCLDGEFDFPINHLRTRSHQHIHPPVAGAVVLDLKEFTVTGNGAIRRAGDSGGHQVQDCRLALG
jgi:hypothetical protein